MIRLFIPLPIEKDILVPLTVAQKHYLQTVMRLKVGQMCTIFNAISGQWEGSLTPDGAIMPLRQTRRPSVTDNVSAPALVFSPVKHKLESIVQKATEMGCKRLLPTRMARSIVRHVNDTKMHHYAVEATQQCHRLDIPTVEPLAPLSRRLQQLTPDDGILLCDAHAPTDTHTGSPRLPSGYCWHILIGPEGGLERDEVSRIQCHRPCYSLSLGPRILRADTAIVAALALYQIQWGDW